jgi:putative holliday junction resolvase
VRVVGVDLGTRRIGVAVSDSGGRVATAHTVLRRTGDDTADRAALAAVVADLGVDAVVVGLPLSLDGTAGPAARWAEAEARELAAAVDVPLHLHDERLTTVTASRRPSARGAGRARRKRPVDDTAAAVLLQSWLDAHRAEID